MTIIKYMVQLIIPDNILDVGAYVYIDFVVSVAWSLGLVWSGSALGKPIY